MGTISINPLSFAQRKVVDQKGQLNMTELSKFLSDLGQWSNQIQQTLINPANLASNLNGNAQVSNTALIYKTVVTGTVTTNQTVDCVNAAGVCVEIAINAALTLTLSHLALGVPVTILVQNVNAGALVFKVSATQPGGTTYNQVLWKTSIALTNMQSTGLSIAAAAVLIASGSSVPNASWDLNMVAN